MSLVAETGLTIKIFIWCFSNRPISWHPWTYYNMIQYKYQLLWRIHEGVRANNAINPPQNPYLLNPPPFFDQDGWRGGFGVGRRGEKTLQTNSPPPDPVLPGKRQPLFINAHCEGGGVHNEAKIINNILERFHHPSKAATDAPCKYRTVN